MLDIRIKTVPHRLHDYETVGDWRPMGNTLLVKVSDVVNPNMEFLVALHELIEAMLCFKRGIAEKDVVQWDLDHPEADEPGEVVGAPYFKEHAFATRIEKLVCKEMGISWKEYNERLAALWR